MFHGGRSGNEADDHSAIARWKNGLKINRYNCAPPRCRTLVDMTEAEIRAIEHEYGCVVIRPRRVN